MSDPLHEIVPAALLQLGSQQLAIPTRDVESVAALPELLRIPLAPAAVAGVAVFAGEPALVVDLSVLLGGSRGRRVVGEPAILCRVADGLVALHGGRIRYVGRLRRAAHEVECPVGEGGVEWRGGTVPLVSPERVMDAVRAARAPDPDGSR